MTHPLFEKHHAKLDAALNAIHTRGYWAAYNAVSYTHLDVYKRQVRIRAFSAPV